MKEIICILKAMNRFTLFMAFNLIFCIQASAQPKLNHRISVYSSYYFFNDIKQSHEYFYNALLPSGIEYSFGYKKFNYLLKFNYWSNFVPIKGQNNKQTEIYSRNLYIPSVGVFYSLNNSISLGGGLVYRNGYHLLRGSGSGGLYSAYVYDINDFGCFAGASWSGKISKSGRWRLKSGINLYYLFYNKKNGGLYRYYFLDYKTNTMAEVNIGLSFLLNQRNFKN